MPRYNEQNKRGGQSEEQRGSDFEEALEIGQCGVRPSEKSAEGRALIVNKSIAQGEQMPRQLLDFLITHLKIFGLRGSPPGAAGLEHFRAFDQVIRVSRADALKKLVSRGVAALVRSRSSRCLKSRVPL